MPGGLTFHHLLCQFSQFPISQSKTWHRVEESKSMSTQPSPRCDGIVDRPSTLLTCDERSQTLMIPSRDPVMRRFCSAGEKSSASTVDEESSSLEHKTKLCDFPAPF